MELKDHFINSGFPDLENLELKDVFNGNIDIYNNDNYFRFPIETVDNIVTGTTNFNFLRSLHQNNLQIKSQLFKKD